jgi:hypothetical protein
VLVGDPRERIQSATCAARQYNALHSGSPGPTVDGKSLIEIIAVTATHCNGFSSEACLRITGAAVAQLMTLRQGAEPYDWNPCSGDYLTKFKSAWGDNDHPLENELVGDTRRKGR